MLSPAPHPAKKWVMSASQAVGLKEPNPKPVIGSSLSRAARLRVPGVFLPRRQTHPCTRQGEAGARQANEELGSDKGSGLNLRGRQGRLISGQRR